jgi:hypothetical protein
MNYREALQLGVHRFLERKMEEACEALMYGLEAFTAVNPLNFTLAGVQPGTNLLGTVCDGLRGGERIWESLRPYYDKQYFALGGFHIGWMAALLSVLYEITVRNWMIDQDAEGYRGLVTLDDIYLAALSPYDRCIVHQTKCSPMFEQALGKAVVYDLDAGVEIAEHLTSPLATSLLASLYPSAYPIRHRFPDQYEQARRRTISQCLSNWQIVFAETTAKLHVPTELVENLTDAFPESGGMENIIHNQLRFDAELGQTIRSAPKADAEIMREALRAGEALILTAAYENHYMFFVVAPDAATACYSLDNTGGAADPIPATVLRSILGSAKAGDAAEEALAELISGMSETLCGKVIAAVGPIVECLGMSVTGAPVADEPTVPPNAVPYRDLGASLAPTVATHRLEDAIEKLRGLRGIERYDGSDRRSSRAPDLLGDALDQFDTLFWVATYPLTMAPLGHLPTNGKRQSSAFLPSGSTLAALRGIHECTRPIRKALIYSNPTGDLDASTDEGQFVAQWLGSQGLEVEHLDGSKATRNHFVNHISEYDMLHVSGHGHGDTNDESATILVLADGALTVSDLVRAKPRLSFVFLNACFAGEQKGAFYGELTGPANLFLACGAATVFAPIIPIRDDMAFVAAQVFYGNAIENRDAGRIASSFMDTATNGEHAFHITYRLYGMPETRIVP